MKTNIDLSVVLPIHNQEIIIVPVVTDIVKVLKPLHVTYELVLVENGSTDQTLTTLRKLQKKYSRIKIVVAPKGYGSAVIAGLKEARGAYVSYMPSDGQLDPQLLSSLYKLITSGHYDLVKICRINREGWLRFIRSKIFNLLLRLTYPIPQAISDINGSPRMFRRKLLPILELSYTDSFIDAEMATKACYLGWKIKEIPARTLPRLGGKSTVSYRTVVEFLLNIAAYRSQADWKSWLRAHSAIT